MSSWKSIEIAPLTRDIVLIREGSGWPIAVIWDFALMDWRDRDGNRILINPTEYMEIPE